MPIVVKLTYLIPAAARADYLPEALGVKGEPGVFFLGEDGEAVNSYSEAWVFSDFPSAAAEVAGIMECGGSEWELASIEFLVAK